MDDGAHNDGGPQARGLEMAPKLPPDRAVDLDPSHLPASAVSTWPPEAAGSTPPKSCPSSESRNGPGDTHLLTHGHSEHMA